MKILVVLPRFPYPLEKGDKLRAYHQIRVLSQYNEIYIFCASHNDIDANIEAALKPYCKAIHIERLHIFTSAVHVLANFMRGRSLQLGYWYSKSLERAYQKFEAEVNPDAVYCQMVRTVPWVRSSKRFKVLDYQDALSMNMERRCGKSRGLWKMAFRYEAKKLRKVEQEALSIFNRHTIISEPDCKAISTSISNEVEVIPNGVDFEYFAPIDTEKQYDVVFCGNMQYEPNVNASIYLIEKVMPLVWKRYPEVRVLLAGATPKLSVKRLEGSRVKVSGWVDDIRQCYASAKLFVAPMLIGSGLQNKLLEAMAMGLPCITTSIANNALQAKEGTDVLVGDDEEQLATHIINILGDDTLSNAIARNGCDFVRANYSWERYGERLNQILSNQ